MLLVIINNLCLQHFQLRIQMIIHDLFLHNVGDLELTIIFLHAQGKIYVELIYFNKKKIYIYIYIRKMTTKICFSLDFGSSIFII